jgi:hypothetical protein
VSPPDRESPRDWRARDKRVDLRHAGVFGNERFGYKLGLGYSSSDTWSRSRTASDSLDLFREYDRSLTRRVGKNREAQPLVGQGRRPVTVAAIGDRSPISTTYASTRFDYYAPSGALGTFEGGLVDLRNENVPYRVRTRSGSGSTAAVGQSCVGIRNTSISELVHGRQTREPQWSLPSESFSSSTPRCARRSTVQQRASERSRHMDCWRVARSTHMNTPRP